MKEQQLNLTVKGAFVLNLLCDYQQSYIGYMEEKAVTPYFPLVTLERILKGISAIETNSSYTISPKNNVLSWHYKNHTYLLYPELIHVAGQSCYMYQLPNNICRWSRINKPKTELLLSFMRLKQIMLRLMAETKKDYLLGATAEQIYIWGLAALQKHMSEPFKPYNEIYEKLSYNDMCYELKNEIAYFIQVKQENQHVGRLVALYQNDLIKNYPFDKETNLYDFLGIYKQDNTFLSILS